ncbi:unnamed protein product, partial [Effrenium voratum]
CLPSACHQALLMRAPRNATVKAKGPCKLLSLSASDLRKVTQERLQSKFESWAKILKNVPDLECLASTERIQIASALVEINYEADKTIMKQGEAAHDFFILLEGRVTVVVDGVHKGEFHADAHSGLHPHFGEQALLNDTVRMATVRSATRSTVLVLGK